MTYIVPRRSVRIMPRRAKPLSMGDDTFMSWLTGNPGGETPVQLFNSMQENANFASQVDCVNQANATPMVQSLDTKWQNLAATWKPTGVFLPADVNTLVSAVVQQLIGAKAVVLVAPASVSDQLQVRMQAVDDIDKMFADGARFSQAATAALASGGVVNAPDLKDYVLKGLLAASNAYVTAAVLSCNVSWLQSVADALDAVGALALKIGGVVVSAAETVVDVAASTFAFTDAIAKYSGPLVVAGVGFFVWWKYFRKKS